MSECANISSCGCDSELFSVTSPTARTALSGQLLVLPITNILGPTYNWPGSNGGCAAMEDIVCGLSGDPDQLYDVALLIRGVCEMARYPGGVAVAGTGSRMIAGGHYQNDGRNLFSLQVSDPAQVYFLNAWVNPESYATVKAVRYNATIQMHGGASITLRADPINGLTITNYPPLTISVLAGEPVLNVNQTPHYDDYGQWLQVDVLGITAA